MDVYNEIHISDIERNTNKNIWLDWEFKPRDPCITSKVLYNWAIQADPSRPNYYIPPSQSFCSLGKTQQTHVHPAMTCWFNKCLITDGHSTKRNRKERKYRNKHFFIMKKENVWKFWKVLKWFIIKKKITQTVFLI